MIRHIRKTVIAFDCEWIPNADAARLLFPGAENLSEAECLQALWEDNGATQKNPTPYPRFMQDRVVSIAAIIRVASQKPDQNPEIKLLWLPQKPNSPASRNERAMLREFMRIVDQTRPQLVGFNSRNADLRILFQRALALGIQAKTFLSHPDNPWKGIDYFCKDNDASIDLMERIVGSISNKNALVSLHQACTLCGIPGKFALTGDSVFELWQQRQFDAIVQYNCYDAISTYLLWLRLAWVSGRFTDEQYDKEQSLLKTTLENLAKEERYAFLSAYIHEWNRLQSIKNKTRNTTRAVALLITALTLKTIKNKMKKEKK